MKDPRIAVVVLTWNGLGDTVKCLRSLAEVSSPTLEVIVVDNGSTDGTPDVVAREFPNVRVVRNDRNLGFAEGNNVGIRTALDGGADHVFLLNNDATVRPDTLQRLAAHASRTPDLGAVSPIVVFSEQPELVWYGGASFDPSRARTGRMLGHRRPLAEIAVEELEETDRGVGAAMLVSAHAIRSAGLMDPELFFLYEDVEWSLRIRRAGFRVLLAGDAIVEHRVAASQGGESVTPTTAYYGTRNHLVVCTRYAPLTRARALARATGILAVHAREAVTSSSRLAALRAVFAGWRDWRRGRLGRRV